MDYEHDAASRVSLVDLQMIRIAAMVREGLPSATLFKVGAGSAFEHAFLCVITLDTGPFRQDPRYATRFLTYDYTDGYPVSTQQVLIANGDFLGFTVDHEVFHCLDACFNGPPIRKAQDAMFSHYQTYVNEARADAFASELFKRKVADPDQFLETFAALRTLSVLALDPHHFTGDVIRHSVNTPLQPPRGRLNDRWPRAANWYLASSPLQAAMRNAWPPLHEWWVNWVEILGTCYSGSMGESFPAMMMQRPLPCCTNSGRPSVCLRGAPLQRCATS